MEHSKNLEYIGGNCFQFQILVTSEIGNIPALSMDLLVLWDGSYVDVIHFSGFSFTHSKVKSPERSGAPFWH